MRSKSRLGVGANIVGDELCAGNRNDITVEAVAAHGDHRPGHPGGIEEHRFDLTGFDAEPTDLDLQVAAADVVEGGCAVGGAAPPYEVAGAIHPLTRRPGRIGDESGRRAAASVSVTAGHCGSAHIQLPHHSDGDRAETVVEDELGDSANGSAQFDRTAGNQWRACVGLDGVLGGPVGVDHVAARRPLRHEFRRAGFTSDDDGAQVREPAGAMVASTDGVNAMCVTLSRARRSASSEPP